MYVTKSGVIQRIDEGALPFWKSQGWLVDSDADGVGDGSLAGTHNSRQFVQHGSTAGTARPSTAGPVTWVGSVSPTNAVAGDDWQDTTTDPYTLKIRGASAVALAAGTSVALGDFARWEHSGAVDGTSGSFDYVADLSVSSGSTVATDASAGWVGAPVYNGWPSPHVTELGTYTVSVAVAGSDACSATLVIVAADGSALPIFAAALVNEVQAPAAPFTGSESWTYRLPAGTHMDVSTSGTVTALEMIIQRVS